VTGSVLHKNSGIRRFTDPPKRTSRGSKLKWLYLHHLQAKWGKKESLCTWHQYFRFDSVGLPHFQNFGGLKNPMFAGRLRRISSKLQSGRTVKECGDYFNSNCFFSATYCSSMGRFSLMVFECNVVLFVFSCWD
jgi:hypothetical protein